MKTIVNLAFYKLFGLIVRPYRKFREVFPSRPTNTYEVVHKKAVETSAEYIMRNLDNVMLFPRKKELWKLALSSSQSKGLHLEFGVYDGTSIREFASNYPDRHFLGFDSFVGLYENWSGSQFLKGAFNRNGRMPRVPKNVTLYRGWFHESIPRLLERNTNNVSFVHFDADTYESTKLVLSLLNCRLIEGSVIVFDEYFGYPGWEHGEFRAWHEFSSTNSINYRYLGFSVGQAAVQITSRI